MKTIRVISSITIFLIAISCQSIILRLAGFHKPKIETKKSIESYLIKNGQNLYDVFALDTILAEQLKNHSFKPGWPADFRPIQIRVYNKNGDPIMHSASCEGFLKDLKTFDTVPPRNQVNLDSTLNLQQDLNRYFTLDGHPAHIIAVTGYDYYIVVYFAKFFYKMSKISFTEVEKYRQKHPELKIKVYKINVDVLDWWNTEIITDIKIHH